MSVHARIMRAPLGRLSTALLAAVGLLLAIGALSSAATARPASLDGTWACSVPAGYTFDSVTATSACATSGVATMVRLRVPVNGLWACTVPPGFTFSQTQATSACARSGVATMYLLVG
jgi:hypothetical protein